MITTRFSVLYAIFGGILIVAMIAIAVRGQQPPHPRPANSPPAMFSAMRAVSYLKVITAKPHPTWSTENARVRGFLLQSLKSLGYSPAVQTARLATTDLHRRALLLAGHEIHNVMVRVPGQQSTGAIAIVSHYDSAPRSFGAADDGAAVAAMLETLRALRSLPPLRNDLIFLFTDAEEAGLHGAKKFVQHHPWIRDIKVVLNFEARGSSGPSLMFETHDHNGKMIAAFAKGDHAPRSTSLFYEVYRRLPNDTDFTVFKRAGLQGLNFAFIEGIRDYHQPTDNLQQLSLATLQDHGEHILSMTKTLGQMDLTQITAPAVIYFDVLGRFLLHYSRTTAVILAGLVLLWLILLLWLGIQRSHLRWSRLGLAFGLQLLSAVVIGVSVGWIAWRFIAAKGTHLYAFYWDIPHDGRYNVAFLCLSAALGFAVLAGTQRWFRRLEMACASLLWWAIVTVLLLVFVPGASYLSCWPLAAGTAMAWFRFRSQTDPEQLHFRHPLLWLLEVPLFLLTVPLFYHLPYALTLSMTGPFMGLFVLFFFLTFSSQDILMQAGRWWPTCASLIAFLILVLV